MHIVFNSGGHRFVHHLQARRDDARSDHCRHRITGAADVVKAGHDAARELRLGHQLDCDLGRDGQHALGTQHNAQGVKPRAVERVRAKLDGLTLNGEAAHLEHVVQREAIFQAVHAARVFCHIAANGAGNLA